MQRSERRKEKVDGTREKNTFRSDKKNKSTAGPKRPADEIDDDTARNGRHWPSINKWKDDASLYIYNYASANRASAKHRNWMNPYEILIKLRP